VPALSDYYIISSREKVENRKSTVRSFYLDAVLLAQYWDIVQPYKYHHTGFPTNCYGLREGLAEIAEEVAIVDAQSSFHQYICKYVGLRSCMETTPREFRTSMERSRRYGNRTVRQ
jgi:aspartate aminotransferase-like enzyme